MILPQETSVVIVGAGPSGLMMAAQLLRQGLHPLIIDSKTSPTNNSRALAIQARSMEILSQLGVAEKFIEEGNIADEIDLHEEGSHVGFMDVAKSGAGKSAFPYVLLLPQSKTERILLSYLTANTCPVFWNTELLDVHQTDERIFIKVSHHDEERYITADWLIGADGANSRVRKSLHITFAEGTYKHGFYSADLTIPRGLDSKTISITYSKDSFAAIFPQGNNLFRILSVLPKTLKNRKELSFEDVKPYLTYTLNYPLSKEGCHQFNTYQLHHRIAGNFQDRRCFLIGDAAHVHSPIGGQGMNTGIQDAHNLAWKLSCVIQNSFNASLLNSYTEERRTVAQQLLKTTDRLLTFSVSRGWFRGIVRKLIFYLFVKKFWKDKPGTFDIFSFISQTGINYRSSDLSVHHSNSRKVQAGDRLPYLKIYDEKQKVDTDLHQWFNKTGFTLLVLGELNLRSLMALAKWIKLNYPRSLNLYYLPPSERNQNVFYCFEVKDKQKKCIIVRPDMYIGYINDIVDVELVDGYLKDLSGKPIE